MLRLKALNKIPGPRREEKPYAGQLFEDSFKVVRRKARGWEKKGRNGNSKSDTPKSGTNAL